MMTKTLQKLRWLMLLSIPLLLAACGGGTESRMPAPTLTDSDYVLEISSKLEAHEFDSGARLWVRNYTKLADDMSQEQAWHYPSFPVADDGSYSITIDARELEGETVVPEVFAEWYLWPENNETMDISVSSGSARLRVLNNIFLYQQEPVRGSILQSHQLLYKQERQNGLTYIDFRRLVFSDRDVIIQGTVGAHGSASRMQLDMRMKIGWNLVYPQSESAKPLIITARPITADDEKDMAWGRSNRTLAESTDNRIAGYSIFTAHQVHDGNFLNTLNSRSSTELLRNITASTWFKSSTEAGPNLLMPLQQILPGTIQSGSMELTEKDTRGMLASIFYYDALAITADGWWRDPALSTGDLVVTNENGNPILLIYSDRSTHVNFNDLVLDNYPDTTIRTQGLELTFGWNFIEATPIITETGTYELVRRTEIPTGWELRPNN